jgi:demethylmenaquinone methyltransferase / 2-methoxy-6-polyprenyl-1,4-benzoquinol methylase
MYLCKVKIMENTLAHNSVTPYNEAKVSKKEQVAEMFNNISGKYDFFNRFLSLGIDVSWRKKALRKLIGTPINNMLDVATGTADVAIMAQKILAPAHVMGIDISQGMLDGGAEKIKKLGLEQKITLQLGDSETINFADNSFDAVTVAFGVRNFENLHKGMQEINRVLKPNGKLVVLEFTNPKNNGFRALYRWYSGKVSPAIVGLFTKNKFAYQYLNNSVQAFPDRENFVQIMNDCGFKNTIFNTLTFGICGIYVGQK